MSSYSIQFENTFGSDELTTVRGTTAQTMKEVKAKPNIFINIDDNDIKKPLLLKSGDNEEEEDKDDDRKDFMKFLASPRNNTPNNKGRTFTLAG